MIQGVQLKVKVASLMAEAKIIRRYEKKAKERAARGSVVADFTRESLHNHRTLEVRKESRSAQLAYGFLRGTPYRVIENQYSDCCDVKRVVEIVAKFGPEPDKLKVALVIQAWLETPKAPNP